jgi:PAS domain S-box-containing protein
MDSDIFTLMSDEEEKILIAYWAQIAEEWTQNSGATLRAIFESSLDGFIMFNQECRVVMFNKVANEVTLNRYGKELSSGEPITDYMHQDEILDFLDNFEQAMRGETIHVEQKVSKLNGADIWIHSTFNQVVSDDARVQGVCLTISDITRRKEIELSLLKDQELFRVLIEGLKDYAFYLLDNHGCVGVWNDGARRLLGYMDGEIIGQYMSIFFTKNDNDHNIPQLSLLMASKDKNYENEGWRIRRDGSHFWAHSVISSLRDLEGNLIGFAEIIRDVTERKKQDDQSRHARSSSLDEF